MTRFPIAALLLVFSAILSAPASVQAEEWEDVGEILGGTAAEKAPPTAEEAAEAERIWKAYEARWGATDSYEAGFRQRIEMPGVGAEVESAGRFYFAKPDRVRWEYTEGPPQTVVGDGRWIWVYQPDLEQVYQVDYATAFGEGGLVALLAGRAGLSERYDATLVPEGEDTVVIDLHPTGGASGAIRVAVDRTTFDLRTVTFVDPAGSTTHMTFDEVLRNQGVDPALFAFTPPGGVDIIRDPAR